MRQDGKRAVAPLNAAPLGPARDVRDAHGSGSAFERQPAVPVAHV